MPGLGHQISSFAKDVINAECESCRKIPKKRIKELADFLKIQENIISQKLRNRINYNLSCRVKEMIDEDILEEVRASFIANQLSIPVARVRTIHARACRSSLRKNSTSSDCSSSERSSYSDSDGNEPVYCPNEKNTHPTPHSAHSSDSYSNLLTTIECCKISVNRIRNFSSSSEDDFVMFSANDKKSPDNFIPTRSSLVREMMIDTVDI